MFVSSTVPFCHRLIEEKGGNLQPEYYLSLLLDYQFYWTALQTYKVVYCCTLAQDLVNWKTVCVPVQYGGSGVHNVVFFNMSLLGKWLWRYAMERNTLWRRIIEAKYGSMWGVGALRAIWGWSMEIYQKGVELLLSTEANYHWNIRFTWPVQDWKLESVASFMDLIYLGSWRTSGADKMCWKPSPRGVLDVRSYYRA